MNRKIKKPKSTDAKVVAAAVNPKKVFDVMKPGKAPANATSRPLIVGHKPQVKDPMMADADSSRPPLLDSLRKVSLAPILGKPAATEAEKTPLQADHAASAAPAVAPAPTPDLPEEPVAVTPPLPEVPEQLTQPAAAAVSEQPPQPAAPVQQVEPSQNPAASLTTTPEPTSQPQKPVIDVSSDLTAEDLAALAMHDEVQSVQNQNSAPSQPNPAAPGPEPSAPSGQTSDQQPGEYADNTSASPAQPTEDPNAPTHGQIVVSTHKLHSNNVMIFWAIVFILLLVIVFDALLDAGTLTLNIPHTHFL